MKNIDPYYQTLFVVWGNQILFWMLLLLTFEWYMLPLAIVAMYFFGCISEISMHRYFAHKAYKTTSLKEKILVGFSTLVGQGAVLSWIAVHRTHHMYEDTPNDPHTPHYISRWRLVLGLFPKRTYKIHIVSDLLRSPNRKYFIIENQFYWLLWSILWIGCFVINPLLLFFVVGGSALWYLCTQLVNIVCHQKQGKKAYPSAVGANIPWINLVTGAGHHNNHHSNPKSYSYVFDREIDVYAFVIRKLFAS